MQIIKPPGKRYVFHNLDSDSFNIYANRYSKCKRYGYRGICAWATGLSVKDIMNEVCKGSVRKWGRRKIGTVVFCMCVYLSAPAITLLTNSTKIFKAVKITHSCVAFAAECVEDAHNLVYLPIDFVLFGQPIPIGEVDRFNLYGTNIDIFDP